jgi:hypothetical protein
MWASGLPVHRNREQNILQPALRRCEGRGGNLLRLRTSGLLTVLMEVNCQKEVDDLYSTGEYHA